MKTTPRQIDACAPHLLAMVKRALAADRATHAVAIAAIVRLWRAQSHTVAVAMTTQGVSHAVVTAVDAKR